MRFAKSALATNSVEKKRSGRRKKHSENDSTVSDGDGNVSGSEWGEDDDNDYLNFLRDFFYPNPKSSENCEDDEADPEYKVREDEIEDHDREELRRDNAVKISKKELSELLAEVFDEAIEAKLGDDRPVDEVNASVHVVSGDYQTANNVEANGNLENFFACPPPLPQVSYEPLTIVVNDEPPPLFTDIDVIKIKYQLQRHLQQLAQTYVLSATFTDDVNRNLATSSRKMILEISTFAKSLGPNSVFSVKNAVFASSLVNSWPLNVCSKSPIKKKILKESYMNEVLVNSNGNQFTRNVIQTIAENPAFMYPDLLPLAHNLTSSLKIRFTDSEDALIAIAYVEMMNNPVYAALKIKERAKVISKLILPGRNQQQVYYRVKNALRKKNCLQASPEDINDQVSLVRLRYHLANRTKPSSPWDSWTPSAYDLEPKAPIHQQELPELWVSLITKWQVEAIYKGSSVNQIRKKRAKPKTPKKSSTESDADKSAKDTPKKVKTGKGNRKQRMKENKFRTLESTPAMGAGAFDESNMHREAVLNNDGDVAAYILVPKQYYRPDQNLKSADEQKTEILPLHQNDVSSVGEDPDVDIWDDLDNDVNKLRNDPASSVFSDLGKKNCEIPELRTDLNATIESVQDSPKEGKNSSLLSSANVISQPTLSYVENVSSQSNAKVSHDQQGSSARTRIFVRKTPEEYIECINRKLKADEKLKEARRKKQYKKLMETVKQGEKETQETRTSEPSLAKSAEKNQLPTPKPKAPRATKAKAQSRNLKTVISDEVIDLTDQVPCDANDVNSNTGKVGSGTSGSGQKTSVAAISISSSLAQGSAGTSGDGNDDEDDRDKRREAFSKDDFCDNKDEDSDDDEKEETLPLSSTAAAKAAPESKQVTKVRRQSKRSSGLQQKKRGSKKKINEILKLLDDADSEVKIEEIESAFAEEFWAKCQHTLDQSTHSNLLQLFIDAGEMSISDEEVFPRAQEVLKDHPDLLVDLATMIDPQILQRNNILRNNYSCQVHIRFMHLLEKLTLPCPQLKSRVLQKLRNLRDVENVTEADVQELIDLYFQGNPVMADALKSIFPAIFPPQSTACTEDFEEINFDDDQQSLNPVEDIMETIVLPEDTNIPATNSCNCECHTEPQNLNYSTKARHCRKCCIKFQDGKVFMLSGRIMKQVNIEFTTKEMAEKILAGIACSHCFKPISNSSEKVNAPRRPPKKRNIKSQNLSDADSEPETKKPALHTKAVSPSKSHTALSSNESGDSQRIYDASKSVTAQDSKKSEPDELEDGEIPDDEESQDGNSDTACLDSSIMDPSAPDAGVSDPISELKWSYEEDSLLLHSCQNEPSLSAAVGKLVECNGLPNRTQAEMQERLEQLMKMISVSQTSDSTT